MASAEHLPDEFLSDRVLAVDLVAEAPGKDAGMVPVAADHLAELRESVRRDRLELVRVHSLERLRAPGGHLDLDEDAVAVAIVQHPAVLLPVDPGQDAVELLQVLVVVVDPRRRLGHAEVGLAAGHALDADQPDRLAVEEELRAPDLDLADAERRGQTVHDLAFPGDRDLQDVEVRVIEMPEPGIAEDDLRKGDLARPPSGISAARTSRISST